MAKIKKRGTSGQAENFITRTQAVRKLQVSLPDFRRLCIYKGIYPREPRNKKKASKTSTASTTFYYTKDIQYLLHEPILNKFRDHKALAKKIARSLGRGEVGDAARLEKTAKPRITLDHIIKERYPTFVDALRDLDDALSLLFLFANLPSTSTVPPKTIALCQRLCLEFEHYLIITHSLRKSFISIKGIYYQATIQGQDILWLVPHKFVQRVTGDVDFRIMGTFVEFYTTLLGFVNYRLYTSIGLVYPPKFDTKSDERGGELSAIILEGAGVTRERDPEQLTNGTAEEEGMSGPHETNAEIQRQADQLAEVPEPLEESAATDRIMDDDAGTDALDKFEVQGEGADVLDQPRMSDTEAGWLFAPYSFFLSRETPRQPLEFLLRAYGCKRISWDEVLGDGAFTNDENDPSITHQVVDRPPIQHPDVPTDLDEDQPDAEALPARGGRMPGRTYIQPQWVWDCINQGKLLRPDLYAPGATMPPHLSPWVKPSKAAYDPTLSLAEQEGEAEAEQAGLDEEEQQELDQLAAAAHDNAEVDAEDENPDSGADHGMDVASGDSDDAAAVEDFGGFGSDDIGALAGADEDEVEDTRTQDQKELEAEAAGLTYTETSANGSKNGGLASTSSSKGKGEELRKRAAKKRKEEEEELERRKMMMSKKKRKLFEKMAYSNRQKDDEAAKLRSKRRKLEKGKI